MKKLMMVLAVVAMAASVQASAFSWKTSATGKIYSAGSTTDLLPSAMAYLFEASATSISSVFTDYAAGTLNLGSALASKEVSAGVIAGTPVEYGADGDSNKFFTLVVLDDQHFFISDTTTANGTQGKTTNINMALKTDSQKAYLDVTGGYQGAGWYQSVPEPTSGLLLLLGMAGLALKRKHA